MAEKAAETVWDLGTVLEGTSPTVRMRIVDGNGALPLTAALSAITRRIYDMTTGVAVEVGTESDLTPADVWEDTAQTGHGWTAAAGYNFEYQIPTASIPGSSSGDKFYLVVFQITPSSGAVIYARVRFIVRDTPGVGS